MSGVRNLAVKDNPVDTAYGFGHKAFTANTNYLISLIVTNTATTNGNFYVYIIPEGSVNYNDTTEWAPIAYDLPLSANNSYETFRFGLNSTDEVWVAGSAGTKFFVQGIDQT